MRNLLAAVSALAILAAPIASHAADITAQGDTVTIKGPIVSGDESDLRHLLDEGYARISLNSPGGLLLTGVAMADEIQAHHASVSVASGAICASACFLLFAAGEHRTYETGARIGVHSVTSSDHLGPDDGDGTLAMARYAAHMGVPAGIVGEMVTTESTGIAWLSEDDLAGMGAATFRERPVKTLEEAGIPAQRAPTSVTQPAMPHVMHGAPNRKGFYAFVFGG